MQAHPPELVPDDRLPPIRSWLYMPGNQPRFLRHIHDTGADAIVLDLEDAVPANDKGEARRLIASVMASADTKGDGGSSPVSGHRVERRPLIFVRLSGLGQEGLAADLSAAVAPGLAGLRLPKVESALEVARVAEALLLAEVRAGLPPGGVPLVCGIESATGVQRGAEIAAASDRVHALAFGTADFQADVGAAEGPGRLETLVARSLLVLLSRAAAIAPPIDSVYLAIDDHEGLERSTRMGKRLGFFGRAAVHPDQLAVINRVFTPTRHEVDDARRIVEAAQRTASDGVGAMRGEGGQFVDIAVVRRARRLLDLSARLGSSGIEGANDE